MFAPACSPVCRDAQVVDLAVRFGFNSLDLVALAA